jgi:anti-anti-sigma factor
MMAGLICDLPAESGGTVRAVDAFEAKVSETGKGVLVRVRGPLDLHNTPGFLQQIRRHTTAGKRLVVDLREAQYVDSAGIRALLQMQKDLDTTRGDLRLVVSPGGRVERVIKLLQLNGHFHLYPSAAAAWSEQALVRPA